MRLLHIGTVVLFSLTGLFTAYGSGAGPGDKTVISGYISDEQTGQALLFAEVYVRELGTGTQSDESGFYSISLPYGTYELEFRYLGYTTRTLTLGPGVVVANVRLAPKVNEIREVVIEAERNKAVEQVQSARMSVVKMEMAEMRSLPAIGGEVDVIKVMQLLPGVTQGGEAGTSLFVRGGDADQNLVLIDDAPVYNISHLLGFFSVFNPDVLDEVTLYKGGFPGQYGGRLSSILDIKTRSGDMEEFHAQGGIGLLSSRLTLEGPIQKGRSSFLISGRRAYIDQVFKAIDLQLPYYFYDLNARLGFVLGKKDRLYFSSYFGRDVLKLDDVESDTTGMEDASYGFNIGNRCNTLRWNHTLGEGLAANLTLVHSNFSYKVGGGVQDNNIYVQSHIRDIGARLDFNYYRNETATYRWGVHLTDHRFRPNIVSGSGTVEGTLFEENPGTTLKAVEGATYGQAEYDLRGIKSKLSVGLRQTIAAVPNKVYAGWEPRANFQYSLFEYTSLKASYARMNQYMHRVSNNNVVLPTDLWYPVTNTVKPQRSHQVAMGVEQAVGSKSTLISIEAYKKWMNNLTEYREGANLILNNNFEKELLQGRGESHGVEFLLKRDEGRLHGWVGYMLSYTTRQFDGLNNGEVFPAQYDRRHNLSIVGTYEISERWDFSATWVYLSGARFTAMIGQYMNVNPATGKVEVVPVYSKRNEIKLSDSHRLDLNFRLKPNLVKNRKWEGWFNIGTYNTYARALPYRVKIEPSETGQYKYTQPGLFGFILNLSYEFKF